MLIDAVILMKFRINENFRNHIILASEPQATKLPKNNLKCPSSI